MKPLRNDARFYDQYYFEHGCGQPYARTPAWLGFFGAIADKVKAEIAPASVLDAGCAMGFLVESLRDRGVEAYGLDLSEYAIAQVRPDMRAFCQAGSVTEPLPRRYGLIVCIEVLEHMPPADAELAIANFCQAADDVLFSSTPGDFGETTHFNVQPLEHWAERFAAHGFVRDVEFDASFITPWAIRFRRAADPWHRVIRGYERKFWQLRQENLELRRAAVEIRGQLGAVAAPAPAAATPTAPQSAVPSPAPAFDAAGPVLVFSHDIVGERMAGPGIRYFQLARALARDFPVVLAVPPGSTLTQHPSFTILQYADGRSPALEQAIRAARTVVISGVAVNWIPLLMTAGVPIAIDGYNPFQAETLFLADQGASDQVSALTPAYLAGDFFMAASERQRDWWLGLLEANGRVNIHTHDEDPTLRRLIDIVPYGLGDDPPRATRPSVKGVWPGIGPDDKVLLWGGGLWPWLDPLTAIRAADLLSRQRPDIRLLFPATRHPNTGMDSMRTLTADARALSADLGLTDRVVFFGDWVPYQDWPNFLLESDVALTLHPPDTLEARLAFRTRVLDYLWAGLPTVAARGDVMADLVEQYGLGAVVEPGDAPAVAAAALALLEGGREAMTPRFEAARRALRWEAAIGPLREFCRQPRVAPDKLARGEWLGNAYYAGQIASLTGKLRWYEGHRAVLLMRRFDPLVLRFGWLRRLVRP